MVIVYIILIFLACFVLVKAGDLVVKKLSRIAIYFRWSEFFVSSILIALATSLPELFVGLTSAINHLPTLSLGNIFGANLINLTVILGLCAILAKGLRFESKISQKNIYYLFIAVLAPTLLALDGTISRLDGLAILTYFSFYLISMFYQEEKFSKVYNSVKIDPKEKREDIIYFIIGLILLIFSAEIVVKLSQAIALDLNLPLILIGLFLVSLGTTLPELTFGLRAVVSGHKAMSLGCSIGTVIFNANLIVGLVAIISPIQIIYFTQFLIAAGFLVGAVILFTVFMKTKNELSWQEGIALIIFYLIFVASQVLAK